MTLTFRAARIDHSLTWVIVHDFSFFEHLNELRNLMATSITAIAQLTYSSLAGII